jgi:DMSO/TMAO reductase YedYZ molybdopterin-dependent catalytic subunit
VTVSTDPQTLARPRPGLARGALTGLISAATALGIAQLVAGITRPQASPVVAVGGAAIDLTPAPVKEFAISTFGSHDKAVLVLGILAVLAVFAALTGVAAMRRLGYGLAGLALFAAIGVDAAQTRPDAQAFDAVPTVVGAVAGAVVMFLLVRAAAADRASLPAPAGPQTSLLGYASGAGAEDHAPEAGAGDQAHGVAAGGEAGAGDQAHGVAAGAAAGAGDQARGVADRHGLPAAAPPSRRQATVTASSVALGGPSQPGRRRFLVSGSVAVAAAGASAVAGRALGSRTTASRARAAVRFPVPAHPAPPLPAGADLRVRGLSPFVTPNSSFYRVDTALIVPAVAPDNWRLRIHGMVEREITVTYQDLLRRPLTETYVTLTCVSNEVGGPYIGNARWLGASLASLLRSARVRPGAEQLLCTSTDGFTSGTPVQAVLDGRDALLAVAMNGAPLPFAHGFPVRMVVPGLYGYVSATKWVTDIKVTTWADRAYWIQRGWSQQGPIKTESRIDVPSQGATVPAGKTSVAGVAWAQHRGIEAVELRVDHGPWQQARLAAVPGIDTWRQWVWDWDAAPGHHLVEARATDRTGHTQTGVAAPPVPNGATGYPSVFVSVQ